MKIVLLEDEPNQRLLLTEILDNHEFICFDKPSDFEKQGKIQGVDLIISDGQMYGETVLDSIYIRNIDYPKVPFICVSANDNTINMLNKMGYDTLTKPFNIKELETMINKYDVTRID